MVKLTILYLLFSLQYFNCVVITNNPLLKDPGFELKFEVIPKFQRLESKQTHLWPAHSWVKN